MTGEETSGEADAASEVAGEDSTGSDGAVQAMVTGLTQLTILISLCLQLRSLEGL